MELIKNKGWRGAGILAIALLFASGIAFAQAQAGNIFAKATDEQGAGLPGVTVTLTGAGAPVSQVTNVNGEVRFLNLPPLSYALEFTLQGFGKVSRKNVTVGVGQNTQINVTMKLAGVQESVVVTGESPLLDTRKTGATAVVSKVELQDIPTARDPWVILQTAPGVQIDRVNVGGSESGQQSVYVGKGDNGFQGTWNVDGVNITDMGALGSSPTYYDFDSFAEIQVSAGGTDITTQTPGAQLNMVTKRGTNDVHGSARVLITDKRFASTNTSEELANQFSTSGVPALGNTIDGIQDYGAEVGGPLVRDKLWGWAAYGRQQINNVTAQGYPDRTTLEGLNLKLNAQVVPENSFTAVYSNNQKIKIGRNVSNTRPPEASWDQGGPTKLYKIEDSHIFSPDVFATVSYSRVIGEFNLIAEKHGQVYYDENAVWHNGFYDYRTARPQTQVQAQPSFFLRTGNVGHEIKVGFNYRTTPIQSTSSWPTGIIGFNHEAYGSPEDLAAFTRDSYLSTDQKYYNYYLSDTMTVSNLTITAGVRYDHQTSFNVAKTFPCCSYDTTLWPQVPFTPVTVAASDPVKWDTWSPRVGLTYALGPQSKTLLKASYARFANQLGGGQVNANSNGPVGTSYLYYYWNDANGNRKVDPGEVDFGRGIYSAYNVDPTRPNFTGSLTRVDPKFKAPTTDEFILGVEHELLPAFVLGLSGTYRTMRDFTELAPLSADGSRVLTPADFNCTAAGPYPVPNVGAEIATICSPKAGVWSDMRLQRNRPGYTQTYWDIGFNATKRYADKWMARFNFTYMDWKQHGISDGQSDPSNLQGGTEADGGAVSVTPGTISGAKPNVFINARWYTTLSAMYTLPLDFNISSSIFAREGYIMPYYRRVVDGSGPGYYTIKRYQLGAADAARLPAVFEWDLGLSKVIKVGGLDITLMADVFNVLNRNTVLQRELRVRSTMTTSNPNDNLITEAQVPRIWRFGARLSF